MPAMLHPLELLLRPAWPTAVVDDDARLSGDDVPRVVCRQGSKPSWITAGDWRLYASLAPSTGPGETLSVFTAGGGERGAATLDVDNNEVIVPFSLAEAYHSYVSERWRDTGENTQLSGRTLGVYYRVKALIPRRVQLALRRQLIRAQGVPAFPAWPVDTSVGKLVRFYAACALRAAGLAEGEFLWFWPDRYRAAAILTHDVESDEGARLALELADLEQELGFRSSFNFGAWYEQLDPGILRELAERGFEIGMHGLTHDRQLFESRQSFEDRLGPLADLAARLGAVGFRSPATHRVFDWLAELPVDYDATIPNSDPYEPQPGGCCSLWPFFIGPVVELPYTLPQDHTLLTLLGHRSPELWLEQSELIEREHGLIQCVSHPDPGYLGDADKRAVYREFLAGLAERSGVWHALPREVAAWWRRRAAADPDVEGELRLGTARLDQSAATVVLEPPA
jgi:peptidoglycan/xylan/chitin deacetylase (PgdA/CDA1 family)